MISIRWQVLSVFGRGKYLLTERCKLDSCRRFLPVELSKGSVFLFPNKFNIATMLLTDSSAMPLNSKFIVLSTIRKIHFANVYVSEPLLVNHTMFRRQVLGRRKFAHVIYSESPKPKGHEALIIHIASPRGAELNKRIVRPSE